MKFKARLTAVGQCEHFLTFPQFHYLSDYFNHFSSYLHIV